MAGLYTSIEGITLEVERQISLYPELYISAGVIFLILIIATLVLRRRRRVAKKREEKIDKRQSPAKLIKILSGEDFELLLKIKPEIVKVEREYIFKPEDIELEGCDSYDDFIDRITKKYRLKNLTITNSEGLVIISNHPEKDEVAAEIADIASRTLEKGVRFVEFYSDFIGVLFKVDTVRGEVIVYCESEHRVTPNFVTLLSQDIQNFFSTLSQNF